MTLKRMFLVFLMVVISISLVRDIFGKGLFSLAKCSEGFRIERCLGLDIASPTTVIEDFYYHAYSKDIHKAKHIIPSRVMESRLDSVEFKKFWKDEVSNFKIFRAGFTAYKDGVVKDEVVDGLAYIELEICYDRRDSWLEIKKNELLERCDGEKRYGSTKRHCSYNKFRLSFADNSSTYPYLWEISDFTMKRNNEKYPSCKNVNFPDPCQDDIAKLCDDYIFSKQGSGSGYELFK